MTTVRKKTATKNSCQPMLLLILTYAVLTASCVSQNIGDQENQQGMPHPKPTPSKLPDNFSYFSGNFAEETFTSGWKLENPDKEKYAFQLRQKSILIVTQEGSLFRSGSLKNRLILNRDLPSGDFEVVVEALFHPIENDRLAVALFADEQNYFELGLHASRNDKGLEVVATFERKTQGQFSSVLPKSESEEWDLAAAQRHIKLKIERQGSLYIGSYEYVLTKNEKWIPVGTLARVGFGGKLELLAYSHLSEQEGAAEFCSVKIRATAEKRARLFFLK